MNNSISPTNVQPLTVREELDQEFPLQPFEAKTGKTDQFFHLANIALCVLGVGGVYAHFKHPKTIAAYVGYIGMACTARKILSIIIGKIAYPATSISSILGIPAVGTKSAPLQRELNFARNARDTTTLVEDGRKAYLQVQRLELSKSGTSYRAYAVTNPNAPEGRWRLVAMGNMMTIGNKGISYVGGCVSNKTNLLLVDGPCVGDSRGSPTRYQMGAAFEAGLQWIEQKIGEMNLQEDEKSIEIRGISLGGGMASEAISNHDFQPGLDQGIQYSVKTYGSFSTLSEAAVQIVSLGDGVGSFSDTYEEPGILKKTLSVFVRVIVKSLFFISGQELDSVSATKKLIKLGIPHTIYENPCGDEVIGKWAGLGTYFKEEEGNKPTIKNLSVYDHPSLIGYSYQDIRDS